LSPMYNIELQGSKIVEVPYFANQLVDTTKSVLIVGERLGGEGVSETIKQMGFTDVTTTDIVPIGTGSWLEKNQGPWKHVMADFIEFDETLKYDYVVVISVFEHFGFWFSGNRMANGLSEDDQCRWNHDIKGILKACRLLKDTNSKLIITLPAGPYMNYEDSGEPFLRGYDWRRQAIIAKTITQFGFYIENEKFYHSPDCKDWTEVNSGINNPKQYGAYSPITPNVIWGLTIKKH
jgi:hypothetical protein